jgi:hypothetical protein
MYWATIFQHRKVGPKARIDFSNIENLIRLLLGSQQQQDPRTQNWAELTDQFTDINRTQQYIPRAVDSRLALYCCCAFTNHEAFLSPN